ncbi:MAG: hypothetical protein ACJ76P_10050, partial [Actinomycetota bacterium]
MSYSFAMLSMLAQQAQSDGMAAAVAQLVGSAPADLDTMQELAAQIRADEAGARRSIRRRDLPGYKALPTVNGSAFTVGAGSTGATGIVGSVLVPMYDTSAFRYFGPPPGFFNGSYPNYLYWWPNGQPGNGYAGGSGTQYAYPAGSSTGQYAVEFDFDTTDGLFEIIAKGSNGTLRIVVNGQVLTPTLATVQYPNDGGGYRHLITLPSAGVYRIRLEGSSNFAFGGIQTLPTNGVTAAPPKPLRCLVAGDSFSEPTLSDTTTGQSGAAGWPSVFGYLTGWDVWNTAKGGTGYINPTTGGTNMLARIGDVTR